MVSISPFILFSIIQIVYKAGITSRFEGKGDVKNADVVAG